MLIRLKYSTFDRPTNRAYGTAMRMTVEQAQIIENYKTIKRKLARKAVVAYNKAWKKNNK